MNNESPAIVAHTAQPSRFVRRRVLVTGGAGFIGSHLCDYLIAQGHEVLCVDNYFTGRRSNIQHLLSHPRFEAMRHDITLPLSVEVDRIYNLACPASPVHYQRYPVETIRSNVHGAINMLDLATRVGARILQASTSEVYGDPLVHPQPESYWGNTNPIGPRACYDEGKRCAETLFFDYHRQHKTAIRVVRIFNTYGPRMQSDDGRVVPAFILQALRGEPMTVFGDGQQTRSFCYVGDLVRGLVDFMEQDAHTGPMNLGNTREMTMLELAEAIVSIVGADSSVSMKPLPLDDPRQRQPDITLARSLIGWEPRVDLVAGLTATVDYFKGELANAQRAESGQ